MARRSSGTVVQATTISASGERVGAVGTKVGEGKTITVGGTVGAGVAVGTSRSVGLGGGKGVTVGVSVGRGVSANVGTGDALTTGGAGAGNWLAVPVAGFTTLMEGIAPVSYTHLTLPTKRIV